MTQTATPAMLTKNPAEIPAAELIAAYRDHRAARFAVVMQGKTYTRDEQRAYAQRCSDFETAFFQAASEPGREGLGAWGIEARNEAYHAHRHYKTLCENAEQNAENVTI